DHGNQMHFTEFYGRAINRGAIPILFYKADGSLSGENRDLAQQIDIYPTVLDLIGYPKPFRSWGRSLFDRETIPFVFNGIDYYQLQRGNYICIFDGERAIG